MAWMTSKAGQIIWYMVRTYPVLPTQPGSRGLTCNENKYRIFREQKKNMPMQSVFRIVDTTPLSSRFPLRSATRPAGGDPRFPPQKPELRDPAVLERLRAAIRRIEGTGPTWSDGETATLPLGVGEIDAHLPRGGLAAGALHEIVAADTGMAGTASAFSAYLASLSGDGPVLWCEGARTLDAGALHPPGLRRFGLEPERLVLRPDRERCRDAVGNGRRASLRHTRRGGRCARRGIADRKPEAPACRRGKRGNRADAAPSRGLDRPECRDDPLARRRRTRRRRGRSHAARLAARNVSLPWRAARRLERGMAR